MCAGTDEVLKELVNHAILQEVLHLTKHCFSDYTKNYWVFLSLEFIIEFVSIISFSHLGGIQCFLNFIRWRKLSHL